MSYKFNPFTGTFDYYESGSASGTVTTVSVSTANGVSGSVANPTTTPAITLSLGAITPTSVNGNTISTGTGTLSISGVASISGSNTGDQTLSGLGGLTQQQIMARNI